MGIISGLESFGEWLSTQTDDYSLTGQLAERAAVDQEFPKTGSPQDVRDHLAIMRADKSWFEALIEAEMNWLQR